MKICELRIQNGQDRADIVAILASAGYRVSIDERKHAWPYDFRADYYVVVEDKEAENERD